MPKTIQLNDHAERGAAPDSFTTYAGWFVRKNGRQPTLAEYNQYVDWFNHPENDAKVPGPLIPAGTEPGAMPRNPGMPTGTPLQSSAGQTNGGIKIPTPFGDLDLETAFKIGAISLTAYLAYKGQKGANAAQGSANAATDRMADLAEIEAANSQERFRDASKLRGPATDALLARLNAGPRATPDVNRFQDTANPFRAKFGSVAPHPPVAPPAPVPPPTTGQLPATPAPHMDGVFEGLLKKALPNGIPATPPAPTAPTDAIPPAPVPPPSFLSGLRKRAATVGLMAKARNPG